MTGLICSIGFVVVICVAIVRLKAGEWHAQSETERRRGLE